MRALKTVAVALLAAWSVAASGADEASVPVKPLITKLKPLYPATPVVVDGRARAFVAIPSDTAFLGIARELQAAVRRRSGAALPIERAGAIVDANWTVDHKRIDGRTIVALGNVNNNPVLARLYGEDYVAADSIYPGAGGHVVRTVHDPWATGVNVLVLAGSDAAGVKKAISVLLDRHFSGSGRDLVLKQPVVDVVFEKKAYPFFPDETKASYSKRQHQYRTVEAYMEEYPLDPAVPAKTNGTSGSVTGFLNSIGETYFRTGEQKLLELMRYRMDKYRAALNRVVIPEHKNMSARTATHVHGWDLVEELPIWTDDERLAVANALLTDALAGHERCGFQHAVKEGYVQKLEENHGTFSAQRSYAGNHYFHKYYRRPDTEYWMKCADAVFSAQASTFQILEDAAGYLWYAPHSTVQYAFESGDLTYLTRGVAYHHAKSMAMACINNLGLSAGFGDSPGLTIWAAYEYLAPVAWFHRCPYLSWIVRRKLPRSTGGRVFSNHMVFDLDVEPKEPVEWTGVQSIPLYENPLGKERRSMTKVFAPKEEVAPDLFNKIVFRENWAESGQYLLLDGAGVWGDAPGPHGHKHNDVNAIINFTDEGRMWLVDHTYEARAFQEHSGVELLREGASTHPERALARLLAREDGREYGLSKTRLGGWTRSIFWKKGRYFLVLDETAASKDGDYVARCSFKGLGEDELVGRELRLSQKGAFCRIVSDGSARLLVEREEFQNSGGWPREYPHAEPVAKFFRQDKVRTLKGGESVTFMNLLYAYGPESEAGAVTMTPVSHTCARVTDRGESVLFGTGRVPGTDKDAEIFVVAPGYVHAPGTGLDAGAAARILAVATSGAGSAGRAPSGAQSGQGTIRGLIPRQRKLGAALDALRVCDLDGDGRPEWLAGESDGLALYDASGTRRWLAPAGARVRAMDVGDLNGDGRLEIAFGSDDRKVRVVASDGQLMWDYACKESAPGRHAPPLVDAVRIADLDHDGKQEVVAIGNWVHVLNHDGRLRWEQYMKFGRGRISGDATCVDVADIDGDGKKEVLVGFLTSYSVMRAMDHRGTIVAPRSFLEHMHAGFYVAPPRECAILDLFGSGGESKQLVCLSKGKLALFLADQDHKTERAGAGQIDSPCLTLSHWQPSPTNATILVVANEAYGVAAYRPYPKGRSIRTDRLWYRTLPSQPARVLCTDLDKDGKGDVVVGTETGDLYWLDLATGADKGCAELRGAPVVTLAPGPAGMGVIVGKRDGTVVELTAPR
ncbi:MAG: VCBS repeat-containing protein [Kiritimatiellae bacterium]|nr:VCBS repeat-containing protein [Kiritimatiellia bacterium]